MDLKEIETRIERAKSDVAFWTRRHESKPTSYTKQQLSNAIERVDRWEREKRFEIKRLTDEA